MDARLQEWHQYMTPEQAVGIRDAFGECTMVYECMTPEELVADFDKFVAEDTDRKIEEWLEIQLTCEAIDGASSEMLAEIRQALRNAGWPMQVLPIEGRGEAVTV